MKLDAHHPLSNLGCILAELYTGYPIFPGENEIEQLACIMEVLDVPPDNVVGHASRKRLFFGQLIVFHIFLLLLLLLFFFVSQIIK